MHILIEWARSNASTIAICTFTLAAIWVSFYTAERRLKAIRTHTAKHADRAETAAGEATAKLLTAQLILKRADDALVEEAESNEVTQPCQVIPFPRSAR